MILESPLCPKNKWKLNTLKKINNFSWVHKRRKDKQQTTAPKIRETDGQM